MFFEFQGLLINSDNITYVKSTPNPEHPPELRYSVSIYFNHSGPTNYRFFSSTQEGLDDLIRKLKM